MDQPITIAPPNLSKLNAISTIPDLINLTSYHARTLWLLIASDIPMLALDTTITLAVTYRYTSSPMTAILARLPLAHLWIITNLAAFALNNQRRPASIAEDTLNKPWRPIPAARIPRTQLDGLACVLMLIAAYSGFILGGGTMESMLILIVGHSYNNAGVCSRWWWSRNLANAVGLMLFASGAVAVTLGTNILPMKAYAWLVVLAAISFSMLHILDMADQTGDRATGRSTLPLVLGDFQTRVLLAFTALGWIFGLGFWSSDRTSWSQFAAKAVVFGLGLAVGGRSLFLRTEKADKKTGMLWYLWLMAVNLLVVC